MADARYDYVARRIAHAEDVLAVAELKALRTTGRERTTAKRDIAQARSELDDLRVKVAMQRVQEVARDTPEYVAARVAEQVERLRALDY